MKRYYVADSDPTDSAVLRHAGHLVFLAFVFALILYGVPALAGILAELLG